MPGVININNKNKTTMYYNYKEITANTINALEENKIYITEKEMDSIIWNARKDTFYQTCNYDLDILCTFYGAYNEQPACVPECLLFLEDSQEDRRIALFPTDYLITYALRMEAFYDYEAGDEERDRFINDLRGALLNNGVNEILDYECLLSA